MSTPSRRERNTIASRKSYLKSIGIKYAYEYELEMIRVHSQRPHTQARHWKYAPEEWLQNAGYITNFNKLRLERLRKSKEIKELHFGKKREELPINLLNDFGVDGISEVTNPETGELRYEFLQAKYFLEKKVTANDIGTFQLKVMGAREICKTTKGVLYTPADLQIDLKEFTLMPTFPIEYVKYSWKHPDARTSSSTSSSSSISDICEIDFPLRDYQEKAVQE
jgi:hypothetical protein